MLEVAMKELKKVAMDFYNITQTQIVLYDKNRKHLYSYPERHSKFCAMICSSEELEEKCIECDNMGFDMCEKTKKPYIYTCHMNLSEAVTPIIENDSIIGYMMIGQLLNTHSVNDVKKQAKKVCQKYNFDANTLLSYIGELKTVDNNFLCSSINMVSMCACYLYSNNIIKNHSDILSHRLINYIENHLSEDLSLKVLCKEFGLSRSKLYNLSISTLGIGISDYIAGRRLEKAKKLLSQTAKPIYEISELAGYKDPNYFVRIFKINEGITPGAFRKNNSK